MALFGIDTSSSHASNKREHDQSPSPTDATRAAEVEFRKQINAAKHSGQAIGAGDLWSARLPDAPLPELSPWAHFKDRISTFLSTPLGRTAQDSAIMGAGCALFGGIFASAASNPWAAVGLLGGIGASIPLLGYSLDKVREGFGALLVRRSLRAEDAPDVAAGVNREPLPLEALVSPGRSPGEFSGPAGGAASYASHLPEPSPGEPLSGSRFRTVRSLPVREFDPKDFLPVEPGLPRGLDQRRVPQAKSTGRPRPVGITPAAARTEPGPPVRTERRDSPERAQTTMAQREPLDLRHLARICTFSFREGFKSYFDPNATQAKMPRLSTPAQQRLAVVAEFAGKVAGEALKPLQYAMQLRAGCRSETISSEVRNEGYQLAAMSAFGGLALASFQVSLAWPAWTGVGLFVLGSNLYSRLSRAVVDPRPRSSNSEA